MALSSKERRERKEIIHVMESLFEGDNINSPILESSETDSTGSMVDLVEIERYIDGKVPPYYGRKKLDSAGELIEISLLFYSSKSTNVPEGKNFLSFGLSPDENYSRVYFVKNNNADIGSFYGQAKKDSSGDGTKLSDIMKVCNSEEIYNIYKKDALESIKSKMPTVYSLFTGGTVIHRMNKNIGTLRVIYYPRLNKFAYEYNPDFILKSALDEWFKTKDVGTYDSLKVCYCYILAFVISHEMLHLIHHNNTSKIDVGADYDKDDIADVGRVRELSNIYTDSFINCKLSRALKNTSGVRNVKNLAPVLSTGIGESVRVRAEHNKGLKKFKDNKDFVSKIVDIVSLVTKEDYGEIYYANNADIDISDYEGADIFIKIRVSAEFTPLRTNSGIFQRFVNETLKVLTDGKVFSGITVSSSEKETDKAILPNGTLVQVKGSSVICSVAGYSEDTARYTLAKTKIADTRREDLGNGAVRCVPVYEVTGDIFGERRRRDIRPFNPENEGAWIEQSGEREKRTKLDQEDGSNNIPNKNIIDILIEKLGRTQTIEYISSCMVASPDTYDKSASELVDECYGHSNDECKDILGEYLYNKIIELLSMANTFGDDSQEDETSDDNQEGDDANDDSKKDDTNDGVGTLDDTKVFHIGDIVWVKRLRKFGKIISIKDGNFELEEVEEIGVRTLDDTDLH